MNRGCRKAMLMLVLLTSLPSFAKNKIEELKFTYEGKARICSFFAPDVAQAGVAPLPLIVLLHGSGRNGRVMVDAWKALAAKEQFLIVAPNSVDPSNWDSAVDSPAFLHAVVEQVKANHTVDPSRIYLFGHSGGANYALWLAAIDSDYYAAVTVHAGSLDANDAAVLARAKRRTPIAIWVGDADPRYPVNTVKDTQRLLQENGFPVELSILPGAEHTYEPVAEQVNRKAWAFFKKTKLDQASADDQH